MKNEINFLQLGEHVATQNSGRLIINYPAHGLNEEIVISLREVYEIIREHPDLKTHLHPEEVESICLFGSCLYKQFPRRFQEGKMPNDLDLTVITKNAIFDERKVIPTGEYPLGKYIRRNYLNHLKSFFACFGHKNLKQPLAFNNFKKSMALHIFYRSTEQLIEGFLSEIDLVSEIVVRYGLPFIGHERFDEILRKITNLGREPLHQFEWTKDLEGKLQCRIL